MELNKNNEKIYDFKEELKKKFNEKIDKEFNDFISELRRCSSQVIIERAYEKVSKEEMIYKIKDKDYTITELKALLKKDNILEECYDEWLKADGNFNEFFDYAVEKRIAIIVDNYKENIRKNGQESR